MRGRCLTRALQTEASLPCTGGILMSLARNQANSTSRYRDPFSVARDLLGWEPFYNARPSAFTPAFEVKETTDTWVVKADLPGVADADLDINVHNNVLTVTGSRQAEERKDGESYALY